MCVPFNHYAKIKRILDLESPGWYVAKINMPTTAQNFKGEVKKFDHYYRIYSASGEQIKYCKFQQIDRLASVLKMAASDIPIIDTQSSNKSH